MAKKKPSKLIVLADEIVVQDKTYKQGDTFTPDESDPTIEGLIVGGAVMSKDDYDEREKELADQAVDPEENKPAEGTEDGPR